MSQPVLSVRELNEADIPSLLDYWFNSEDDYLVAMGFDLSKMPTRKEFSAMLYSQLNASIESKKAYAIIWCLDDVAVGHSNINAIQFAEEASMHLHIWKEDLRKSGNGLHWLKLSIPFYFQNFKLKRLICEPYSLNPAPHKTIEKLGFELEKEYTTTPGFINFEQPVKRWILTSEKFYSL